MFTLPDLDIGFACAQTKVFVRKNGTAGPLKEVKLPPSSKLCDLFEKASKVLDLECPQRAYLSNGVEVTDMDQIEDDEVLHVSCGEPFRLVEGGEGRSAGQVVGNYILHEKLGQGGFGSVLKGVHSETGDFAAVKFVPKKSFRQISDLQRVFQEIQALRNLRHPNIIKILDVADSPDSICFIMEFAAGGELRGYVEKHKSLDEEEARQFFKQITRAVHYIHSKRIIHRDLKLENILLDASNQCKIVDFGLSDYVSSKERTVTDAGTEAYLAPEVYNGFSGYADPFKIDSWALGVILYAMTHGKLPFSRPDSETCAMLDKEGPTFSEKSTPGLGRLVKTMLTPNPDKRASVNEISVDSWVTKHRFAMCSPDSGGLEGDDFSEEDDRPHHSSEPDASEELELDADGALRRIRRAATSPAVAINVTEGGPSEASDAPAGVTGSLPPERHPHREHRKADAASSMPLSPRFHTDTHLGRAEGLHRRDPGHSPASPRAARASRERKERLFPAVGAAAIGAGARGSGGGAGSSLPRSGLSPHAMSRRSGAHK